MTFKPGQSGNSKGRPIKVGEYRSREARVPREDGWRNLLTAMGTRDDKRTHAYFSPDIVTDVEAESLWLGDDICKRIVENVPNTAFRRGITLKMQDKAISEDMMAKIEEVGLLEKFVKACQYENAYAGAALFPVTNDVGALETPLDENNIPTISAFHLLEPRELSPVTYYRDINNPKYGQPEIWRLIPLNGGVVGDAMMTYIHESRLVIFPGRRITRRIQGFQRPGWGHSVLSGVYPIIRDFGSAWGNAAALLEDFAQGVLSMDGYGELMKTDEGEATVKARLRMLDLMRSTMRMMIVDKGDTFSRQTTPMGGLSDILHDFALRVSAAAEQPVTVLFGMAPAGLNATGDNDIRGWYDTVSARREHHYKPRLERAICLLMLAKDSPTKGIEPDVWSAEFPPLWEPTEKEIAETRWLIAQTDEKNIQNSIYTGDDAANSHYRGDTFSADIEIDWTARDAQKKVEEQMAKEAHDAELARLAAPVDPNAAPPVPAAKPPTNGIQQRGG